MQNGPWRVGTAGPVATGAGAFVALASGYLLLGINRTGVGQGVSMLAFALVGMGVALATKQWPHPERWEVPDQKRRATVHAVAVAAVASTLAAALVWAGAVPVVALATAIPAILAAAVIVRRRVARLPPAPRPWPALLAGPCILVAAAILYAPLAVEYGGDLAGTLRPSAPAWQEDGFGSEEGRLAPPAGGWVSAARSTAGATHLNVSVTWTPDILNEAAEAEADVFVQRADEAWHRLAALPNGSPAALALPEDATHWRMDVQGTQAVQRSVRLSWHLAWSPGGDA